MKVYRIKNEFIVSLPSFLGGGQVKVYAESAQDAVVKGVSERYIDEIQQAIDAGGNLNEVCVEVMHPEDGLSTFSVSFSLSVRTTLNFLGGAL